MKDTAVSSVRRISLQSRVMVEAFALVSRDELKPVNEKLQGRGIAKQHKFLAFICFAR